MSIIGKNAKKHNRQIMEHNRHRPIHETVIKNHTIGYFKHYDSGLRVIQFINTYYGIEIILYRCHYMQVRTKHLV